MGHGMGGLLGRLVVWVFDFFFFQGKQKLTTYIVLFIKDEKFSFSDHLTQIYVDPNSVI